MQPTKI